MTVELILSSVALALATYGAGLSTYIHMRRIRSERHHVSVSIHTVYPLTGEGIGATPETLSLVAVNTCQQDIVVEALLLEIYGFVCLSPQVVDDPDVKEDGPSLRVLKPGHRCDVSFNYPHLVEWLLTRRKKIELPIQVRGVFVDTLESRFYSSWHYISDDDIAPLLPRYRQS